MSNSYTAATFFQRYITQQYTNSITDYNSSLIVGRYYFALLLTDDELNALLSSLPLQGNTVLKGALLYYNTYFQTADVVIFYYSASDTNGYSFNAAYFSASNWPTDFDPTLYVCQCQPLTVPPGVVFDTTPVFYETNATIPSCNTLQYRIYNDPISNETFNYVGDNKTIQSDLNAFLTGVSSYVNNSISLSTSVKRWAAINAQYIQQLPCDISSSPRILTGHVEKDAKMQ